jgi:hypothetical protein
MVRSPPRQIVCETLSRKKPTQERDSGVAQGVGPEFKPQNCKKKKRLSGKCVQLSLFCCGVCNRRKVQVGMSLCSPIAHYSRQKLLSFHLFL